MRKEEDEKKLFSSFVRIGSIEQSPERTKGETKRNKDLSPVRDCRFHRHNDFSGQLLLFRLILEGIASLVSRRVLRALQTVGEPPRAMTSAASEMSEMSSQLSHDDEWAPTTRDSDDEDDSEGVAEDDEQLKTAARDIDRGHLDFAADGDETEMSSEMIRVDTSTDLRANNPAAFFSDVHAKKAHGTNATQHSSTKVPKAAAAVQRGEPSASLRVQHSDVWLHRFILPKAHDEQKAQKLESVGKSSSNLTPERKKNQESREVATLRLNVENSHFALRAMEKELEESLAQLQGMIPPKDFLQVVARCTNLRKQAVAACLQASLRAQKQP